MTRDGTLAGGVLTVSWPGPGAAAVTITGHPTGSVSVGGVAATFPRTLSADTIFDFAQDCTVVVSVAYLGIEILHQSVTLSSSSETTLAPGDLKYGATAIAALDTKLGADVVNTGTTLGAALAATYTSSRKVLVPAARVRTWGHSYMHGSGTGVTPGSNDMATLIAAGLDLPLDQQAVSGAVLYNHLSAADWASIVQYETRPTRFAALGGVYALMYGINDTAYLGLTQAALLPYKHALRATIARLRSSAVLEDSDASVTYGGSGAWVAGSGALGNSGGGWHYNPTSGGTFTITTPTNFPGGVLNVGLIAWNDGSAGVVTGPSSLGSPSISISEFAGTDCRRAGVLRIHNVPAGSAAYVFTTSAVTGTTGVVFDYWSWEPPEDACPIVAVISQPKPLDYTAQAGSAFPGTDAGVIALNAVQTAVVAEFGARVLYVDTSAMDKSATYFVAGNLHPNAAGHAYIANLTLAAIGTLNAQFLQADLNGAAATTATSAWTNYTPTVTGVTLGAGTVQASYRVAGDSVTEFYCRVTLAADSAITGAVTVALPSSAVTAYSKVGFDVTLLHSGVAYYAAKALLLALGTLTIRSLGTAGVLTDLSSSSPFTWATNDYIEVSGRYRAA